MIDVNGKNNKVEQKNNKKIKTMGDVTLKGYDMTNTVTKGTGVRVHKQWAHAEHDTPFPDLLPVNRCVNDVKRVCRGRIEAALPPTFTTHSSKTRRRIDFGLVAIF